MNNTTVVFGLPTYGHISPAAHISTVALVAYSVANKLASGYLTSECSLVDVARNKIVYDALQDAANPTHIMWVDDDIVVPKTTLRDLLAHEKPIVGALYHKRVPPYDPVVYSSFDPLTPFTPKSLGLHRVAGLGFGCTLIEIDTYRKMYEHFEDRKYHAASFGDGEDVWFFKRCQEIGLEVWVDASIQAGHVTDGIVYSAAGLE